MDYQLQILGSPRSPRSKKDRMTAPRQIGFSSSPHRFNNSNLETKVRSNSRESHFGNDLASKKSLGIALLPNPTLRSPYKKQISKRPINQLKIKSVLSDYLYNAMDWSQRNCVGIALDTKVVLVRSPFDKKQTFHCNFLN